MKSKKILLFVFSFLAFVIFANYKIFFQLDSVYAAFGGCSDPSITVPSTQCQALEDFYNATNGAAWAGTGWLQSNDVCTWSGITCDSSVPKRKITSIVSFGTSSLMSGVVPWSFYSALNSVRTLNITYQGTLPSNNSIIFSSSGLALMTGLRTLSLGDCGNCNSVPVRKVQFNSGSNLSDLSTLVSLQTIGMRGVIFSANIIDLQTWTGMSGLTSITFDTDSGIGGSLEYFSGINLFQNLQTLRIACNSSMNITGTLLGISNLFNLVNFTLSSCAGVSGGIPDEIGQLTKLKTLFLSNLTGLAGGISNQLSTLGIQTLTISNTSLHDGTDKLCGLTGLTTFSLSSDTITGSLPACICDSNKLTSISIAHPDTAPITGRITGPIPICIGNDLLKLTSFSLANLNLSGSQLPTNFGNLTGLTYLGIHQTSVQLQSNAFYWNNFFSTTTPLAYGLTGTIPTSLSSLNKLQSLILPSNAFVGSIPDIFGGMKALKTLNLSYNQNMSPSVLPSTLVNHTGLVTLGLHYTKLTGSLDGLSGMKSLTNLFIYSNQLFAPLPFSYFSSVFGLRVGNNFNMVQNLLYGKVPLSIVNPSSVGNRFLTRNYCLDFSDIIFSPSNLSVLDTYSSVAWRNQPHCADIDVSVTQTPTNPKQLDVVTYTLSYNNVGPNPVSGRNLNFTKPAWLTGIIASRGFSVLGSDINFSGTAFSGVYASGWSTDGVTNFSITGFRYFAVTGQRGVIVLTGIMADSGFSLNQISRINNLTGSAFSGNEINYSNNNFSLAVNVSQPVMNAISPTQCVFVLTGSQLKWYYNGPAVSGFVWQVSSQSGVSFDANIIGGGDGNILSPGATIYNGTQSFSPFASNLNSGSLYYWRIKPYVNWNGQNYTGDGLTDICFGIGGPPWFDIKNHNCDPATSKQTSAIATGYTTTGLLVQIPAGVGNTGFFYKIIDNSVDCSGFPTGFLSYTPGSNIDFGSGDNGKFACFYARDDLGAEGYALSNPVCGIDSTLPACNFDFYSTPGNYYQTGGVTYLNSGIVDFSWTGSELLSGVEFSMGAFSDLFTSVVPFADAGVYTNFYLGNTGQNYNVAMQCQDLVGFTGSNNHDFFLDTTAPSMPLVDCSTSFFDADFSFGWSSSIDVGVGFEIYDRQLRRLSDSSIVLSDNTSNVSQNFTINNLDNFTGYSFGVRSCDFLGNCSSYSQCDFSIAYAVCGDGVVMSPESCDDSNTDSGDGCSSTCNIETTSIGSPVGIGGGGFGGGGGGGGILFKDLCPEGDFSATYYDKKCDAPKDIILSSAGAASFLDFCSYDDEDYSGIEFSDIKSNRHKESINLLLDLCIVRGAYQKNLFLPEKSTTRGEFMKIVVKLLGAGSFVPMESNKKSSYYDASGHWAATYFEEARRLGIITDLEKKTKKGVSISPNSSITQFEARKILERAFTLMGASKIDKTVFDAVFPKNKANDKISRDFFAGVVVKVFDLTSSDNIFFSYLQQIIDNDSKSKLMTMATYKEIEDKNLSKSDIESIIKNMENKPLSWYKKMNLNRDLLVQQLNYLKAKTK